MYNKGTNLFSINHRRKSSEPAHCRRMCRRRRWERLLVHLNPSKRYLVEQSLLQCINKSLPTSLASHPPTGPSLSLSGTNDHLDSLQTPRPLVTVRVPTLLWQPIKNEPSLFLSTQFKRVSLSERPQPPMKWQSFVDQNIWPHKNTSFSCGGGVGGEGE